MRCLDWLTNIGNFGRRSCKKRGLSVSCAGYGFASRTAFENWYARNYFDHPSPDEFDRYESPEGGPLGAYRYGDVRQAWAAWESGIAWMQNVPHERLAKE